MAKQQAPADAEIRITSVENSSRTSVGRETSTNPRLTHSPKFTGGQTTRLSSAAGKVCKSQPFSPNAGFQAARYAGSGAAAQASSQHTAVPRSLRRLRTEDFTSREPVLTATPSAAKLREAEHQQQPLKLGVFLPSFSSSSPSPLRRS